jgi:hypothetical protein
MTLLEAIEALVSLAEPAHLAPPGCRSNLSPSTRGRAHLATLDGWIG